MKILLLEDDPNLAKTLVKFLQKNGYDVDWARQGEEAIDLSYENRYDLYLFDVNVPLVSGTDVLTQLREADDTTPAIMISAQIDVDSVAAGFGAGADDYVKKPFDPKELLVRIQAKIKPNGHIKEVHGYAVKGMDGEVYCDGRVYRLGEVSRQIFVELIKAYPEPADKETLMALLTTHNDGALRVNIAKLKKETGLEIEAVRGVGYKIL